MQCHPGGDWHPGWGVVPNYKINHVYILNIIQIAPVSKNISIFVTSILNFWNHDTNLQSSTWTTCNSLLLALRLSPRYLFFGGPFQTLKKIIPHSDQPSRTPQIRLWVRTTLLWLEALSEEPGKPGVMKQDTKQPKQCKDRNCKGNSLKITISHIGSTYGIYRPNMYGYHESYGYLHQVWITQNR